MNTFQMLSFKARYLHVSLALTLEKLCDYFFRFEILIAVVMMYIKKGKAIPVTGREGP
jgi:hypothetical protein